MLVSASLLTAVSRLWPAVFACSLVAGAVDDTPDRVKVALRIFLGGILVLFGHIGLYIYRIVRKKTRSGWIFWISICCSIPLVLFVYFMVAISAGMSCGIGASDGPVFLLVLQTIAIAVQIVSWKFLQRTESPIPGD